MPSTNGHGSKRAILYARVSTEEQVRKGYSLDQQIEAGREWAVRAGYEVVAEIVDAGASGAYLERPGLDQVRDLVEGTPGGVSVVWAQDADRITREPIHRVFLDDEFERFGARLVALDDWGDNTHEGELLKYLKGWVSKGERLKIAERSRRGLLKKARGGKVVATHRARFGFRFNSEKDGYELDLEKMAIVKEIFRMAGVERRPLHAIRRSLEDAGIATPTGKKYWCQTYIRNIVLDDIYRPHTYEEVKSLTS
jgi:site-specific DNA recombinase